MRFLQAGKAEVQQGPPVVHKLPPVSFPWPHSKQRCMILTRARLRKTCVYMEDSLIVDSGADRQPRSKPQGLKDLELCFTAPSCGIDVSSHDRLQKSTVDFVLRIFDSWENVLDISTSFFTGTHQRISAICRSRYMDDVASLLVTPQADVAVLCLCILLIEQRPVNDTTDMLSPLYLQTKNLITLLETRSGPTLNLVQCRVLVTFYEMGHGFQTTAYGSIAACARSARALGLHKKRWRKPPPLSQKTRLEEEKRAWWTVIIMDRFINMCNADPLLATDDPETKDPLPIDDLVWAEASDRSDIEESFDMSPLIDTSFHITVGQMARECQVSYLLGRVVQLVFDPTSDSKFNVESARQLVHTLKAYLPLLSYEELKIGRYCGAYGMCNRLVFSIVQCVPKCASARHLTGKAPSS